MLQNKKHGISQLISSNPFWFTLFVLITAISRLVVIDGQYHIYSWDAGNFVLACRSYSLSNGRPHLPGYFFHVQFIRMLAAVTGDFIKSINLFSVLYSSLASGFLYLVLKRWFTRKQAVLFTLLVLSNPLVWYYGVVPEIYTFDLFFGICLVWMSFSPYTVTVTPSLMALGTGIRPSSGVFLLPVYIYIWYTHLRHRTVSRKAAIQFHIPALVILLAWFGPVLINTGGLTGLWQVYQTNDPVEKINIWHSLFRLSSYLYYILPAVSLGLLGWIFNVRHPFDADDNFAPDEKILLNLWLWPSVLFFILVHYSKGYLLISIIPLFLLLFMRIKRIGLRKYLLILTVAVQSLVFIFQPFVYPEPQLYFSSDERKMNPFRVWFERTGSDYAMTASRLAALQDTYNFVEALTDHELILINRKKYIFIDPTVMISTRALQAMFPENYFTKLLFGEQDLYGEHHGLEQEALSGVRDMIGQAIIVSRTSFVNDYLRVLSVQILTGNEHWTAFTVKQNDIIRLEKIYYAFFLR